MVDYTSLATHLRLSARLQATHTSGHVLSAVTEAGEGGASS